MTAGSPPSGERLGGAERFALAAAELGVGTDAGVFTEGTRTAAAAAAAIGCELSQIVKSLVLVGPDGPLLVLTAGHHRLDLHRVATVVGGTVRMADATEARDTTGYAIGGMPPFGHHAELPTWIDVDLLEHDTVWAAAGTPDRCFPVRSAVLIDAARATPATVAELS